ncbi:MAG TPA: hypothetical protein VN843_18855 [Anaerolineales bacterium]|nr:hypothetical protein [Anaerolineales bacterium]
MKTKVKAIQFELACAYYTHLEQFKGFVNEKIEALLASFFSYAFSKRAVQEAIVAQIHCRTPIGMMLNDHIEEAVSTNYIEVEADNVKGLDQAIESHVEDAFRNFEVNADDVNGLEDAIMEAIDADKIAEHVMREIRDRLT